MGNSIWDRHAGADAAQVSYDQLRTASLRLAQAVRPAQQQDMNFVSEEEDVGEEGGGILAMFE